MDMEHHDRKRDPDKIDLESPLGIADEPIVQTPADHLPDDNTEEGRRRRRARALGEDGMEETTTTSRDDHGGASSVDMGYGGEGTDLKTTRRT
jgi:hypothetical protein